MQTLNILNNFNNYPVVDPYSNYMMILSRSLKLRTGYQLIATKYHMSYELMSIDFENFSNNLLALDITNDIVLYRILSAEKYSSLSPSETKIKTFNVPGLLNTQFAIATLSLNQLFELSFFQEYILKCSEIELSRNIIFMIEDIRYLDFLTTLKNNEIVISGGSNKYQHILSPIRFRLTQIIACIENGRHQGVNHSYHLPNKREIIGGRWALQSTKPNLNWVTMNMPGNNDKK